MDEPAFKRIPLRNSRVVIWGLGLMGGSLAMALKDKCGELAGIDTNLNTVTRAVEMGVVSCASTRPEEVILGANLVVLAIPVGAILDALSQIPEICPDPAVILDLGSTKRDVVDAMARLPNRFDPIGGHPMCGKEKSSLEYAEEGLYKEAAFALVATERTTDRGRSLAEEIVRVIGARPLWMAADVHDQMVAATSHAPYLLASALAQATPLDAAPLAGPGFRSVTRLAGSSTEMMLDILRTNTDNVRNAIREFKHALENYEMLLEQGNFELLKDTLEQGAERYRHLLNGR